MDPTSGRLSSSLAAVGVAPHDIRTVLLIHLHPPYVGGLVDGDGHAVLPGAELIVHEAELVFWQDDAVLAKAAQDMQACAYATNRRGPARYQRCAPSRAHAWPYRLVDRLISSGSRTLLIWCDVVHMPGIQFAPPGVGVGFDVDGGQVIERRRVSGSWT